VNGIAGRRVAVLGGGWAGMAASVELADAGAQVAVFEAAQVLGGRARAIEYRGTTLDNGAHILIGAYRQALALMRKVGVDEAHGQIERAPLDLNFPGQFRLRVPALPRPLHLALALATCRGLSWGERLGAARLMHAAQSIGFKLAHDTSVADLLARHRQGPRARRYLWEPLCVAALNTRAHEASAQVFLNVLRDSLDGERSDSELVLPRRDLSSLFPAPAADYVGARGGRVVTGCAVQVVRETDGGFEIAHAHGRERCDAVVCALPPYRVAETLAPIEAMQATARTIDALEHEPITCIYIQYPEAATLPQSMVGLDGAIAQWAFDRGRLTDQPGLVCAVVSARGEHEALSHETLAARVTQELGARFPELGAPRWSKVIAEKRATFSCRPGLQRPDQRTPLPGLVLAGDYTASPYPGTLEAAVRSGVRCARLLIEERHVQA